MMKLPASDVEVEIAEHFTSILGLLGLQLIDPNLTQTPRRYARAILELTRGLVETDEHVRELMSVVFPSSYDEMIVVAGIETAGVCPHHFLPIEYDITIGYIPSEPEHLVVGLSKLPRLAELLSARPVLQEQLTDEIVRSLLVHLVPRGAGAIVVGKHGCMTCRGVKQRDGLMITTKLVGNFRDQSVKEEFLSYRQRATN